MGRLLAALCHGLLLLAAGLPSIAAIATPAGPVLARHIIIDISSINSTSPPSVNQTALDDLPTCARECQDRILALDNCTLTGECYCKYRQKGKVFHEITSCVQQECPTLENLLQWQRFRAGTCNVKPRDETRHQAVASYTLFIVATLFVACRFVARSRWMHGPGYWWDDWVVLAIWALSIEMVVLLAFQHRYHAGVDSFALDRSDLEGVMKWVYISEPFYFMCTFGTKLSLVLLYLRIWEGKTAFRKICWVTATISAVGMIGFTIGSIFTYWPPRYYQGDSARIRSNILGITLPVAVFGVAAWNITLDIWVLLLPIFKLMTLRNLSRRRKIGISLIFITGFSATVCSIVRVIYIIPLQNSTNVSWDFANFGLWTEIELHLSMICCNMPAIASLGRRLWAMRRSSSPSPAERSMEMADVSKSSPAVTNHSIMSTTTPSVRSFNTTTYPTPTDSFAPTDEIWPVNGSEERLARSAGG